MSTQVTEKKPFYKSKTIWASFFGLVYAVAAYINPELAMDGGVIAGISSVLFTVLRFATGVEITLTDIKK